MEIHLLKIFKKEKIKMKKIDIKQYLEKQKPEIDRLIKKYLPKKITKKWLNFVFGRAHYLYSQKAAKEVLLNPIHESLGQGGKRWRSCLFLLITKAVGGDIKKIKDFLIIPEFIHQGSLCIDDIEDDSKLRRGRPCLYLIFGTDVAINVGNFLYFFPLILLIKNKNKFRPETLIKAYELYIEEMTKLHLGQGTDIYWHKGRAKEIKEKEYLQMCAFKTGCLSRLASKLAVILSEKDDQLVEKIGKTVEALGIAFQIQDDILDLTLKGKERKKFGKSFGNDIKEGKRTLIIIHTLKKANKKDKKRLLEILNKHTDKFKEKKEAIEIIERYGGKEYAQRIAQKLVKKNWQEIEKLLPESEAKTKLKELVNYLIERKI